MGCFCKNAFLGLSLPTLSLTPPTLPALPGASAALSLSADLAAVGLPALPWTPDPAWLSLKLPTLSLSATAMATISALAQLQASVKATLGLDLLVAAEATAFARIVATMGASLSAPAGISLSASLAANLQVLIHLGAVNFAADQIRLALDLGVLIQGPALHLALPSLELGFGLAAKAEWKVVLRALFALMPMIAVSLQLGLALDAQFAANLAASIKILASIKLPEIDVSAALNLTAALSAIASLKLSLGVDPLTVGLPEIHAMIRAKLALIMPGLSVPRIAFCPTIMATSAVVSLAASMDVNALVGLNWQVPPVTALASLRLGLPTVSLVAALQAALSIKAVLPSPCGPICNAGSVLRAAMAA